MVADHSRSEAVSRSKVWVVKSITPPLLAAASMKSEYAVSLEIAQHAGTRKKERRESSSIVVCVDVFPSRFPGVRSACMAAVFGSFGQGYIQVS